jgi:hypothetical protein
VERVLTKRFHAVVGNPPYITEKDSAKRRKYRDMYESAAGKYALAAPFTERFFDLGVEGGFVGLINSNAWTKRDYGKTLIEKVLPRLDLHKIVDTSGCYLPGHGTPTLLLFGRNRRGASGYLTAVLGKRGERDVPVEPSTAPVWSEIREHHNAIGFDGGRYVSVEAIQRKELAQHPWVLAGGGARGFLASMSSATGRSLGSISEDGGIAAVLIEEAPLAWTPQTGSTSLTVCRLPTGATRRQRTSFSCRPLVQSRRPCMPISGRTERHSLGACSTERPRWNVAFIGRRSPTFLPRWPRELHWYAKR